MGVEKGGIDISKAVTGGDQLASSLREASSELSKATQALENIQKQSRKKIKIDADASAVKNADAIIQRFKMSIDDLKKEEAFPFLKKLNDMQDDKSKEGISVKNAQGVFTSTEDAQKQMIDAWNSLIDSRPGGVSQLSDLVASDDKKATAVLRWANAFEALGGDIASVSPLIDDFIQKMRSLKVFSSDKGYTYTVENLKLIFEQFKELQKLGATFKNFQDMVAQMPKIKPLKVFGSDNTEEYEEETDRMEKSTERQKKALLSLEEIKQRLAAKRREKTNFYSDNDLNSIFGFDDDFEDSDKLIQTYSKVLKRLQDERDKELDDIEYWQNAHARAHNEGDDSRASKYFGYMEESIKQYYQYADAIEYVQGRLQEATLNFKPGESWGANEIQATITLLQELAKHIDIIRQKFETIDSIEGFQSLIEDIGSISTDINNLGKLFNDVFASFDENGKIISMTSQLQSLVETVRQLGDSLKDAKFNINIGSGESIGQIAARQSITSIEAIQKYKRAYEELLDLLSSDGNSLSIFKGNDKLFKQFFEANELIGGESKTSQLQGYKIAIEALKQASSIKGIDLSQWIDEFEKVAIAADQAYEKVIMGNSTEDIAQKLFGGGGNISVEDFKIISDQIKELKNAVISISQILSDVFSPILDTIKVKFGEAFDTQRIEELRSSMQRYDDELDQAISELDSYYDRYDHPEKYVSPSITDEDEREEEAARIKQEADEAIEASRANISEIEQYISDIQRELWEVEQLTQSKIVDRKSNIADFLLGKIDTSAFNQIIEYIHRISEAVSELKNIIQSSGSVFDMFGSQSTSLSEKEKRDAEILEEYKKIYSGDYEKYTAEYSQKSDRLSQINQTIESLKQARKNVEEEAAAFYRDLESIGLPKASEEEVSDYTRHLREEYDDRILGLEFEKEELERQLPILHEKLDVEKEISEQKMRQATKIVDERKSEGKDSGKDKLTDTGLIQEESTKFTSVGEAVGSITQKIEEKNSKIREEAEAVESASGVEVEYFQAIEFAVEAIVQQLNNLLAVLPSIKFDEFIGSESASKLGEFVSNLTELSRILDTIDDKDVFHHLNDILQAPGENFSNNLQKIKNGFNDLKTVMNGFNDNGSAVFKSLSDIATAGDAVIEKMQKLFEQSGVKLPLAEQEIVGTPVNVNGSNSASRKRVNIKIQENNGAQKRLEDNLQAIRDLGKANTMKNLVEAKGAAGKASVDELVDSLQKVREAAEKAEIAIGDLYQMKKEGLISQEDLDRYLELYESDEIVNGTLQSQSKAQLAIETQREKQVRESDKAIKQLSDSYIELAQAEEKAANASTEADRELGRRQVDAIKLKQKELREQVGKLIGSERLKTVETFAQADADEYKRLLSEKRSGKISTSINNLGFSDTDNVEKTWDTLISKASRYQAILYKEKSGKTLTATEAEFLQKLKPLYDEAGNHAEQAGEKYNQLNDALKKSQDNIKESILGKYEQSIGGLTDNDIKKPDAYNEQVKKLKTNLEELKKVQFGSDDWFNRINLLDEGLKKLNSDASMKSVKQSSIETLDRKMAEWINSNSAAGEFRAQVEQLRDSLSNIRSEEEFNGIVSDFERVKAAAADAGKTGQSFGEGLIKRFKSLGQYLLSFASFYRIIGTIKQAVSIVTELNDALTEMRKVSSESLSTLEKFQFKTFDLADQVGTNAVAVQKSTAAWLRLGKDFNEAQQAAVDSTKLLNTTEIENIDDATSSLLSITQAYREITREDAIDKINNIGDHFSSSSADLAQGLKNVSAVLKTQGNDIDQALALLTAGKIRCQMVQKCA